MSTRIVYDLEMPPEIKHAVDPIIRDFAPLLPGWLHELRVGYDGSDSESMATCKARPRYRWARLTICGAWIGETVADRAGVILHEFVHIPTHQLVEVVEDLLIVLKREIPSLEPMVTEQLDRAKEALTCDLTRMLLIAIQMPPRVGPSLDSTTV